MRIHTRHRNEILLSILFYPEARRGGRGERDNFIIQTLVREFHPLIHRSPSFHENPSNLSVQYKRFVSIEFLLEILPPRELDETGKN